MRAEDLLHQHRHPLPITQTLKLSVNCPHLDRLLHGGIPVNSITEIVAESGTGKTQLCLQLLLAAQLPLSNGGLSSSSLFLHSEFPFPFRRLQQLSSLSYAPHLNHNPLDRVYVHPLHSADHLLDLLPRLDSLIPNLNIKLIVIDSIAALFRGDFENTPVELKRRSGIFFKVSSQLRFYARKYGLVVVVTNQVVDVMESSDGLRMGNLRVLCTSGRRVSAALGLSWANCVNTRLFMWREEEGGEDGITQTRRFIRVDFAPHLPDSSCEFIIRKEGVYGVDR